MIRNADRRDERRRLRALRRALPPTEQRAHAQAAARLAARLLRRARATRVALYLPADGELDPRPLRNQPGLAGVRWALPVLRRHGSGRLWFARWRARSALTPNRYGIPEPVSRRRLLPAQHLDLILLPLVGFDADGNRLGMGGGYYDRSLGFLRARRHWQRPRLIGLAHDCQRVAGIEPGPWDVPLDAVVTEVRVYRRRGPRP